MWLSLDNMMVGTTVLELWVRTCSTEEGRNTEIVQVLN